jgi:hypothetical protein
MTSTIIAAGISESVFAMDTATTNVRTNLSVVHLLSASKFCRATGIIEQANIQNQFGEFWDDIQTQAIATVLTAVAGLEAFANELFVDHAEVFSELRIGVMEKLWELYEQKSILDKYEFALLLRNGVKLERDAAPYQGIAALIKLRNALTHYKPEWSDQESEHAKVSKQLKGRATASSFFSRDERLFPRAWACHGTTKWAVTSVTDFILDFEKRASINSRLAPFETRLRNL